MITKYNNLSLALGVPGIILQIAGMLKFGPVVQIIGTLLLLVGLTYYAKAEGRNPLWCLMAFLSIIGLIVLAALEDRAR